ncbi:hypothetical protein MAR_005805 [Mya arenaria]|uniref:Uncharacterized protein n=1 Tax=Mya arenaria TaxID=6604 RepID=A0ABY7F1Z1_MYAAR|nr:hypothetical protein MAR_005805 [Mya arenaria]
MKTFFEANNHVKRKAQASTNHACFSAGNYLEIDETFRIIAVTKNRQEPTTTEKNPQPEVLNLFNAKTLTQVVVTSCAKPVPLAKMIPSWFGCWLLVTEGKKNSLKI